MGTAVAEKAGTDVAPTLSPEELQALQAQQEGEIDSDLLTTPLLKIGQPLTKEVQDENAEAGDFIDSISGDSLGNKVEFIVSYYQKGRFAADRESGRAYVAFDDTIPEAWADLVGEEFVGTQFSEYPDAEEQYKARVNRKEIEWGKGPLVSTTHNFTGLVVVQPIEGSDGEAETRPVRLSLQRTNVPVVRKWLTLHRSQRNTAFWDKVFDLSTEKKVFDRGTAYILTVKLGRDTVPAEKAAAVELAQAVAAGRVVDNQVAAAGDKPVEPKAEGALEV